MFWEFRTIAPTVRSNVSTKPMSRSSRSSPSRAPYCPVCDYDLAALPGVPAERGGESAEDIACPECGVAVAAGGRIVEGSTHPDNLAPNTRFDIAACVANAVFATYLAFCALLGLRSVFPNVMVAFVAVFMGCNAIILGRKLWLRRRQATTTARAGYAGRQIRWVASSAGLECIDRNALLVPSRRTVIPASRIHRVTGDWVTAEVWSGVWSRSVRGAAGLTAWEWKMDAQGLVVDLVPTSIYTLDAMGDGGGLGASASVLAANLETSLGLRAGGGYRSLPQLPLVDRVARIRFLGSVVMGCVVLALVPVSVAALMRAGTSSLAAVVVIASATAICAAAGIYFGRLALIRRARRRWAREHVTGLGGF